MSLHGGTLAEILIPLWLMGTLPDEERTQYCRYDREVKHPSLLMHDKRCQEAVMKEKQYQENGE